MVNFLYVPVFNKSFGENLDEAFARSTKIVSHTIDEAAVSWMIAENFRLGNPMSTRTGLFCQEFSYQPRGHAKYADIVRLFGWEAIEGFFKQLSEDYDYEIYTNINQNNDLRDARILRMSVAAGYGLRSLIHFWGIHPLAPATLEEQI